MHKYNKVTHTKVSNAFLSQELKPYSNKNLLAVKVSKRRFRTPLEPAGEALDNTVSIAVQPRIDSYEDWAKNTRNKLYSLRRDIGQFYKRVAPCGAWAVKDTGLIPVALGKSKNVYYSNLQTCKSVWACPVCSMKIHHQRANEVRELLTNAIVKEGKKGVFLTLTIPHVFTEQLPKLQKAVSGAFNAITADVRYKGQYRTKKGVTSLQTPGIKQKFGVLGFVRALEVKRGAKGWHPHLHVVYILDPTVSESLQGFADDMVELWADVIKRVTGKRINRYAQDWQEITKPEHIADYTCKWDLSKELVYSHAKEEGRGLTPFQIMQAFQETGDEILLNDFLHFCKSMHRVKQLTFSKNLKKMFLPGVQEATDQEACEETLDKVLLSLKTVMFKHLVKTRQDAHFLNLCQFHLEEVLPYLRETFGAVQVSTGADGSPVFVPPS